MRGKRIGENLIAVAMVEVVLILINVIGTLGMIIADLSVMSTTDMRGMHIVLAMIQEVADIPTAEEWRLNIAGQEMIQTDIPVISIATLDIESIVTRKVKVCHLVGDTQTQE